MKNISSITAHVYRQQEAKLTKEDTATECLVRLHVNNEHLTSLLASPEQPDDLMRGHMATEHNHVVNDQDTITVEVDKQGIDVHLTTDSAVVKQSRRNIVVSSCGACHQHNLSALVNDLPIVDQSCTTTTIDAIVESLYSMREHQHGFLQTGGMHAAGLFSEERVPLLVREDIGRHNAVDKVIGALHLQRPLAPVALVISGRCGWDIVAKAARTNIPVIASFGAASSLAVEAARASNITLVSFVSGDKAVIMGPLHGRFSGTIEKGNDSGVKQG